MFRDREAGDLLAGSNIFVSMCPSIHFNFGDVLWASWTRGLYFVLAAGLKCFLF